MKRLTREALERLSYAKGREIEIDTARNLAVLTVNGQEYCAELDPVDAPAARILGEHDAPKPPRTESDAA